MATVAPDGAQALGLNLVRLFFPAVPNTTDIANKSSATYVPNYTVYRVGGGWAPQVMRAEYVGETVSGWAVDLWLMSALDPVATYSVECSDNIQEA